MSTQKMRPSTAQPLSRASRDLRRRRQHGEDTTVEDLERFDQLQVNVTRYAVPNTSTTSTSTTRSSTAINNSNNGIDAAAASATPSSTFGVTPAPWVHPTVGSNPDKDDPSFAHLMSSVGRRRSLREAYPSEAPDRDLVRALPETEQHHRTVYAFRESDILPPDAAALLDSKEAVRNLLAKFDDRATLKHNAEADIMEWASEQIPTMARRFDHDISIRVAELDGDQLEGQHACSSIETGTEHLEVGLHNLSTFGEKMFGELLEMEDRRALALEIARRKRKVFRDASTTTVFVVVSSSSPPVNQLPYMSKAMPEELFAIDHGERGRQPNSPANAEKPIPLSLSPTRCISSACTDGHPPQPLSPALLLSPTAKHEKEIDSLRRMCERITEERAANEEAWHHRLKVQEVEIAHLRDVIERNRRDVQAVLLEQNIDVAWEDVENGRSAAEFLRDNLALLTEAVSFRMRQEADANAFHRLRQENDKTADELRASLAQVRRQLQDAERQSARLTEDKVESVQLLQASIDKYKTDAKTATDELSRAKIEISNLQRDILKGKQCLRETEEKLQTVEEEKQTLERHRHAAERQLEERLAVAQRSVEAHGRRISSERESEVNSLTNRVSSLQKERDSIQAELLALKQTSQQRVNALEKALSDAKTTAIDRRTVETLLNDVVATFGSFVLQFTKQIRTSASKDTNSVLRATCSDVCTQLCKALQRAASQASTGVGHAVSVDVQDAIVRVEKQASWELDECTKYARDTASVDPTEAILNAVRKEAATLREQLDQCSQAVRGLEDKLQMAKREDVLRQDAFLGLIQHLKAAVVELSTAPIMTTMAPTISPRPVVWSSLPDLSSACASAVEGCDAWSAALQTSAEAYRIVRGAVSSSPPVERSLKQSSDAPSATPPTVVEMSPLVGGGFLSVMLPKLRELRELTRVTAMSPPPTTKLSGTTAVEDQQHPALLTPSSSSVVSPVTAISLSDSNSSSVSQSLDVLRQALRLIVQPLAKCLSLENTNNGSNASLRKKLSRAVDEVNSKYSDTLRRVLRLGCTNLRNEIRITRFEQRCKILSSMLEARMLDANASSQADLLLPSTTTTTTMNNDRKHWLCVRSQILRRLIEYHALLDADIRQQRSCVEADVKKMIAECVRSLTAFEPYMVKLLRLGDETPKHALFSPVVVSSTVASGGHVFPATALVDPAKMVGDGVGENGDDGAVLSSPLIQENVLLLEENRSLRAMLETAQLSHQHSSGHSMSVPPTTTQQQQRTSFDDSCSSRPLDIDLEKTPRNKSVVAASRKHSITTVSPATTPRLTTHRRSTSPSPSSKTSRTNLISKSRHSAFNNNSGDILAAVPSLVSSSPNNNERMLSPPPLPEDAMMESQGSAVAFALEPVNDERLHAIQGALNRVFVTKGILSDPMEMEDLTMCEADLCSLLEQRLCTCNAMAVTAATPASLGAAVAVTHHNTDEDEGSYLESSGGDGVAHRTIRPLARADTLAAGALKPSSASIAATKQVDLSSVVTINNEAASAPPPLQPLEQPKVCCFEQTTQTITPSTDVSSQTVERGAKPLISSSSLMDAVGCVDKVDSCTQSDWSVVSSCAADATTNTSPHAAVDHAAVQTEEKEAVPPLAALSQSPPPLLFLSPQAPHPAGHEVPPSTPASSTTKFARAKRLSGADGGSGGGLKDSVPFSPLTAQLMVAGEQVVRGGGKAADGTRCIGSKALACVSSQTDLSLLATYLTSLSSQFALPSQNLAVVTSAPSCEDQANEQAVETANQQVPSGNCATVEAQQALDKQRRVPRTNSTTLQFMSRQSPLQGLHDVLLQRSTSLMITSSASSTPLVTRGMEGGVSRPSHAASATRMNRPSSATSMNTVERCNKGGASSSSSSADPTGNQPAFNKPWQNAFLSSSGTKRPQSAGPRF